MNFVHLFVVVLNLKLVLLTVSSKSTRVFYLHNIFPLHYNINLLQLHLLEIIPNVNSNFYFIFFTMPIATFYLFLYTTNFTRLYHVVLYFQLI